jgi:hypothetical protein
MHLPNLSVDEIRAIWGFTVASYSAGAIIGKYIRDRLAEKNRRLAESDVDMQISIAEARLRELNEVTVIPDDDEIDDEIKEQIEQRNHWLISAKRWEKKALDAYAEALYWKGLYEEKHNDNSRPSVRSNPDPPPPPRPPRFSEFRWIFPRWRELVLFHRTPRPEPQEERTDSHDPQP